MQGSDQRRMRYAVVRCPEGACGEEDGVLVKGYSGQQHLGQHCLVRHGFTLESFAAVTKSKTIHSRIALQKTQKVMVSRDCIQLDLDQMQALADRFPALAICKGMCEPAPKKECYLQHVHFVLYVGCFQPEADYDGQIWHNVFLGLTDDIKHAHTSNNRGHGFGSGRSVLTLKAAIADSVKYGYKLRNVLSSQITYKLVSPDKSKTRSPAKCKLNALRCSALFAQISALLTWFSNG